MNQIARLTLFALIISSAPLGVRAQRRKQKSLTKKAVAQKEVLPKDCLSSDKARPSDSQALFPLNYGCEFGGTDLLCGGCVGGKLINRPKLCYPRVAKFARLSGRVKVKIVVNETGEVIWARILNRAHDLLRAATLQEALERKYEPFVCNRRTVKAVVYLTYEFGLP